MRLCFRACLGTVVKYRSKRRGRSLIVAAGGLERLNTGAGATGRGLPQHPAGWRLLRDRVTAGGEYPRQRGQETAPPDPAYGAADLASASSTA